MDISYFTRNGHTATELAEGKLIVDNKYAIKVQSQAVSGTALHKLPYWLWKMAKVEGYTPVVYFKTLNSEVVQSDAYREVMKCLKEINAYYNNKVKIATTIFELKEIIS
jgi:hypothetical protein